MVSGNAQPGQIQIQLSARKPPPASIGPCFRPDRNKRATKTLHKLRRPERNEHQLRDVQARSVVLTPSPLLRPSSLPPASAAESQRELFMDSEQRSGSTQSLAPNRKRPGKFKPADGPKSATQKSRQRTGRRLEQQDQKVAALEAAQCGRLTQPVQAPGSRSAATCRPATRRCWAAMKASICGRTAPWAMSIRLGDADKNYRSAALASIFQGDVGDRLSFYLQPDFASSAGTTGNVAQLQDAYSDVYLTTDRVHRLRVGQVQSAVWLGEPAIQFQPPGAGSRRCAQQRSTRRTRSRRLLLLHAEAGASPLR